MINLISDLEATLEHQKSSETSATHLPRDFRRRPLSSRGAEPELVIIDM